MATPEEQLRIYHVRNQETIKTWQALIGQIANGNHKKTYTYQEVTTLLTFFADVANGHKTSADVMEKFKNL